MGLVNLVLVQAFIHGDFYPFHQEGVKISMDEKCELRVARCAILLVQYGTLSNGKGKPVVVSAAGRMS